MPTAYSYTRFSTPEQSLGGSLTRQAEAAAEWARTHGYDLDATHTDLGVSARRGSHRTGGALARFLAAIEGGRIARGSALVIEAIDRLSRETPAEAAEFMLRIINSGIHIVTLEDQTEYTTETIAAQQHLMYVLIGKIQQANGFSERLAMRVTHGRREGRAKRLAAGLPITAQSPGWLKVVNDDAGSRYVPIPERVETVRYVFESIAAGMAKQAIAKELNNRGVPSFRTLEAKAPAAGWGTSAIFKMATNRALIGEFCPTKTEYIKDEVTGKIATKKIAQLDQAVTGYYPVVIDLALFNRVNSIQMPKGPKGQTFSNLLQGIPRCAHCGGRMTCRGEYRVNRPTRNRRILVCDNYSKYYKDAAGKAICTSQQRMKYTTVESYVLDNAQRLVDIEDMQRGDATSHIAAKILANDADIARVEKAILNALDNLDGPASPTVQKWIEGKEAAIIKLRADNAALEKKRRAATTNTAHDYRQLSKLFGQAQAETDTQRCAMMRARINTILRQTVDQLHVDPASKTVIGWFGGGRMLAILVEGITTRYAVTGDRMTVLRSSGINTEYATPSDILAQHLSLTRGESVSRTDMPGVFAGIDLSAILLDPTEHGFPTVIDPPANASPALVEAIRRTYSKSFLIGGRFYVYPDPATMQADRQANLDYIAALDAMPGAAAQRARIEAMVSERVADFGASQAEAAE